MFVRWSVMQPTPLPLLPRVEVFKQHPAKGSGFQGSFPLRCLHTCLEHGLSSLETPGATASPSQAAERLRLLITLTCCQGSHVTGCYVAFCRYALIVWLNSCLDAAAASSPYLFAAGINCDRARLVVAELLVVWQVYHDAFVRLVCTEEIRTRLYQFYKHNWVGIFPERTSSLFWRVCSQQTCGSCQG